MKRLVLLGGGHAHIEVLRAFALEPCRDCEIVVATPYPWLTYSGMVPGFVAGHYPIEACTIDLKSLAARADARLVLSPAASLDPQARVVSCADGTRLEYDVVSLDVGSRPFLDAAVGVERNFIVLRPLERLVQGWSDVLARAHRGDVRSITLVGTGAAGIELAFAMHHRLRAELGEGAPHLRLIGDGAQPVPELSAGARRRVRAEIVHRRIESHQGSGVIEVGARFVRLRNGLEFATDAVFWAAGSAAHRFVAASGIAADARGYMLTNDFLQSVSHANVFGAGDCATSEGHPRPKAGVFAVRAGPALAANLRAAIEGRALRRHVPGRRYLALISAGDRYAIGTRDGFSFEGEWVWRWKDRIDRAFARKYNEYKSV
jgi:selenide,water dikinase